MSEPGSTQPVRSTLSHTRKWRWQDLAKAALLIHHTQARLVPVECLRVNGCPFAFCWHNSRRSTTTTSCVSIICFAPALPRPHVLLTVPRGDSTAPSIQIHTKKRLTIIIATGRQTGSKLVERTDHVSIRDAYSHFRIKFGVTRHVVVVVFFEGSG